MGFIWEKKEDFSITDIIVVSFLYPAKQDIMAPLVVGLPRGKFHIFTAHPLLDELKAVIIRKQILCCVGGLPIPYFWRYIRTLAEGLLPAAPTVTLSLPGILRIVKRKKWNLTG